MFADVSLCVSLWPCKFPGTGTGADCALDEDCLGCDVMPLCAIGTGMCGQQIGTSAIPAVGKQSISVRPTLPAFSVTSLPSNRPATVAAVTAAADDDDLVVVIVVVAVVVVIVSVVVVVVVVVVASSRSTCRLCVTSRSILNNSSGERTRRTTSS